MEQPPIGLKYLTVLSVVLAVSVAAIACSGDDDAGDNNGGQPAATTEAPVNGDGDSDGDGDGDGGSDGDGDGGSDGDGDGDGDGNGDGDGDGNGDGDGGSPGSGSATLTIGGEAWSFDDVICVFSPEEAGNDFTSFSLSAPGETAEGVQTLLQATILDKGNVATYSVSVVDAEDFDNPTLGWSSPHNPEGPLIKVDGKNVTADTTFDDQLTDDVIEEVPGTLHGTCP